jgi:hypothetical protein
VISLKKIGKSNAKARTNRSAKLKEFLGLSRRKSRYSIEHAFFGLVLLVIFSSSALAANVCAGPSASGNGSGNDWNNLFGFNTGTLVRGDTYYLADGNYASRSFSTPASGATLITIKKATEADHGPATGWSSTYGDGQAVFRAPLLFASNYWVLNGQTRTGLRSGYGIKVDNNTVKASMDGNIKLGNTNPATASYVIISYVELAGTGDQTGTYWEDGVLAADEIYSTNITIDHCWIHDQAGVNLALRALSNVIVEYSVIERDYSSPASHSEGVVLKHTNNVTFRYNILSDIEGTGYIATPSGTRNSIANTYIYSNVFEIPTVPKRGGSGMGPVAVFDCDSTGDFIFYNNTIINFRNALFVGHPRNPNSSPNLTFGTGYTATFTRAYIKNNLWVSCDAVVNPAADQYTTITDYQWSHNAYYNTATWDGSGRNNQVLTSMPLINWPSGDYNLVSATMAGATLPSPFNIDPSGAVRGVNGMWDRGAFQFGGGISAPKSVRIIAPN